MTSMTIVIVERAGDRQDIETVNVEEQPDGTFKVNGKRADKPWMEILHIRNQLILRLMRTPVTMEFGS